MLADESPDTVVRSVQMSNAGTKFAGGGEANNENINEDEDEGETVSLLGKSLRSLADLRDYLPVHVARRELTCIRELNLYNNELVSIADLRPLRGLCVLNVSANNLAAFDAATLRHFPKLRVLDYGSNCIKNVDGVHELVSLSLIHI